MRKVKDLVVKTGEYQKDGQTKARYENIGSIFEKDGKQFILMKRTFNPAGVPSDRDTIMVGMFDADNKATGNSTAQAGGGGVPDEIPF